MAEWYVIRSATRQEERVVNALAEHGLKGEDVYLPRETRWWRLGRVRRARDCPLLPGYLFVHIAADKLWRIERLDGVHAVLRRSGAFGERQPVPVAASFLAELHAAERAGLFDRTKTARGVRVVKGEKVRIAETAALAGWVGEIMAAKRNGKVAVLLSAIGNLRVPQKTVEVSAADLEPVEHRPAA